MKSAKLVQTFNLSFYISISSSEGLLSWWHIKSEVHLFYHFPFLRFYLPFINCQCCQTCHQTFKSGMQSVSFLSSPAGIRWLGLSADTNQWTATIYTAYMQYTSPFPNTKQRNFRKRVNMLIWITSIHTRHTCSTGYKSDLPSDYYMTASSWHLLQTAYQQIPSYGD
jgi:hypothetical protein